MKYKKIGRKIIEKKLVCGPENPKVRAHISFGRGPRKVVLLWRLYGRLLQYRMSASCGNDSGNSRVLKRKSNALNGLETEAKECIKRIKTAADALQGADSPCEALKKAIERAQKQCMRVLKQARLENEGGAKLVRVYTKLFTEMEQRSDTLFADLQKAQERVKNECKRAEVFKTQCVQYETKVQALEAQVRRYKETAERTNERAAQLENQWKTLERSKTEVQALKEQVQMNKETAERAAQLQTKCEALQISETAAKERATYFEKKCEALQISETAAKERAAQCEKALEQQERNALDALESQSSSSVNAGLFQEQCKRCDALKAEELKQRRTLNEGIHELFKECTTTITKDVKKSFKAQNKKLYKFLKEFPDVEIQTKVVEITDLTPTDSYSQPSASPENPLLCLGHKLNEFKSSVEHVIKTVGAQHLQAIQNLCNTVAETSSTSGSSNPFRGERKTPVSRPFSPNGFPNATLSTAPVIGQFLPTQLSGDSSTFNEDQLDKLMKRMKNGDDSADDSADDPAEGSTYQVLFPEDEEELK